MIDAISYACLYFSNYEFSTDNITGASYAYYYSITDAAKEGINLVYLGYYGNDAPSGDYWRTVLSRPLIDQ